MVSSAIYRYFPSRDAVLTALIVETYGELAAALRDVDAPNAPARERFVALAGRFLEWGAANPADFALVYGTPVSDYRAPEETIEPAGSVVAPFLEVIGAAEVSGQAAPVAVARPLSQQASPFVGGGLSPDGVTATITALTLLVGALNLHIGGHYVGSFDPFEEYAAHLAERAADLAGLTVTPSAT